MGASQGPSSPHEVDIQQEDCVHSLCVHTGGIDTLPSPLSEVYCIT